MNLRYLTTALTTTAALSLTACSGDGDKPTEEATTPMTASAQLPAPVIRTPEEIDGQEVTINSGRPLVINVPDHPEHWTTGSVDDRTIAQFTPGRDDGSATYNPGFTALSRGESSAHIADPTTGTMITFTLTVSD